MPGNSREKWPGCRSALHVPGCRRWRAGIDPARAGNPLSTMTRAIGLTRMVYAGAMARTAPTLPITPKMFQHFAAITIVTTLILSFFANGENREMVEEEIAQQQAEVKAKQAARAEPAVKSKVRDNREVGGGFGPEPGAPPEYEYVDPYAAAPWAFQGNGGAPVSPQNLVYHGNATPQSLERKDPLGEQHKKLLKQRPQPTEEQVAQLVEASRERSGTETITNPD